MCCSHSLQHLYSRDVSAKGCGLLQRAHCSALICRSFAFARSNRGERRVDALDDQLRLSRSRKRLSSGGAESLRARDHARRIAAVSRHWASGCTCAPRPGSCPRSSGTKIPACSTTRTRVTAEPRCRQPTQVRCGAIPRRLSKGSPCAGRPASPPAVTPDSSDSGITRVVDIRAAAGVTRLPAARRTRIALWPPETLPHAGSYRLVVARVGVWPDVNSPAS